MKQLLFLSLCAVMITHTVDDPLEDLHADQLEELLADQCNNFVTESSIHELGDLGSLNDRIERGRNAEQHCLEGKQRFAQKKLSVSPCDQFACITVCVAGAIAVGTLQFCENLFD